jgi:hypothetical protein
MKRENLKWAILSVIVAFSSGVLIGCMYVFPIESKQTYKDVGGNIDIEYYLEVSEDSIWIENYNTHRVYGGKYSQLDSLINVDNL